MKTIIYTLVALLVSLHGAMAQPSVPNAGFEIWDSTLAGGEAPIYWSTTASLPTLLQKVSDAHTGDFAARLNVAKTDTSYTWGSLNSIFGFGQDNPIIFYAWVKTHFKGTDVGFINATTAYRDIHSGNVKPVGSGTLLIDSTYNDTIWRLAAVHLDFPDSISSTSDSSTIVISFDQAHDTGSYFIVDDVRYSDVDVSSISKTNEIIAAQEIYPVPATGFANMIYAVNKRTPITLNIYDMVGNKTETVINETQNPGIYRAEISTLTLPGGMYVAVLRCDGGLVQQKFMVQH